MAVTNYYTVDGLIEGESTSGVHTDYLTDALGSVTATVNSSAQVVNTYRHKSFGSRLAKAGAGADPRFQWTGDSGSTITGMSSANQYNINRHYDHLSGTWNTRDILWPVENAFTYAYDNPTTMSDPNGMMPSFSLAKCRCLGSEYVTRINNTISSFCGAVSKSGKAKACIERKCLKKHADMSCLTRFCKRNSSLGCVEKEIVTPNYIYCMRQTASCPRGCAKADYLVPPCGANNCNKVGARNASAEIYFCCGALGRDQHAKCQCPQNMTIGTNCDQVRETILHELYHVCGINCESENETEAENFAVCVLNCLGIY